MLRHFKIGSELSACFMFLELHVLSQSVCGHMTLIVDVFQEMVVEFLILRVKNDFPVLQRSFTIRERRPLCDFIISEVWIGTSLHILAGFLLICYVTSDIISLQSLTVAVSPVRVTLRIQGQFFVPKRTFLY